MSETLSCFDDVEQAGLIAYLAEQDERLKQLEVVQKSLHRLADSYGAVTLTVEERKHTTEIERLLSDFPECLEIWKNPTVTTSPFNIVRALIMRDYVWSCF